MLLVDGWSRKYLPSHYLHSCVALQEASLWSDNGFVIRSHPAALQMRPTAGHVQLIWGKHHRQPLCPTLICMYSCCVCVCVWWCGGTVQSYESKKSGMAQDVQTCSNWSFVNTGIVLRRWWAESCLSPLHTEESNRVLIRRLLLHWSLPSLLNQFHFFFGPVLLRHRRRLCRQRCGVAAVPAGGLGGTPGSPGQLAGVCVWWMLRLLTFRDLQRQERSFVK